MSRKKNNITMMATVGYKPYSKSEPGVYVRNAKLRHENTIDWNSEPTELLESLKVQLNNIKTYPLA